MQRRLCQELFLGDFPIAQRERLVDELYGKDAAVNRAAFFDTLRSRISWELWYTGGAGEEVLRGIGAAADCFGDDFEGEVAGERSLGELREAL